MFFLPRVAVVWLKAYMRLLWLAAFCLFVMWRWMHVH